MSTESSPPEGVLPINIRGVTCQKYGLKTGDGPSDYAKHQHISKLEMMKEIQLMGVMSDFEPGKKYIESYDGDQILFVIDLTEKYGEMVLMYYTKDSEDNYFTLLQQENELLEQQSLENDQSNQEIDTSHIYYEEKPIIPKMWQTSPYTIQEIELNNYKSYKSNISYAISRPKSSINQPITLTDTTINIHTIKSQKQPINSTIHIQTMDTGFQVNAPTIDTGTQTIYNRPINRAIQYQSQSIGTDTSDLNLIYTSNIQRENTLVTTNNNSIYPSKGFLKRTTILIEQILNQNNSIDIFHDTFNFPKLMGGGQNYDPSGGSDQQADNDLKEIRNFADPMYSKSKLIIAIEWLPFSNSHIAVSPVKNSDFSERLVSSG